MTDINKIKQNMKLDVLLFFFKASVLKVVSD